MSLTTGQLLPDLALPRADGAGTVQLRPRGRKGIVVVLLHGPDCEVCRDYVTRLADLREQIEDWDGRIVLVSTAGCAAGSQAMFDIPTSFHQARDVEGVLAGRAGVPAPAVFIADQWGELFAIEGVDEEHRFAIQPEEVVDWLRFLAIKCPECEGEAL
jgi:peroxiredoxin